jgi:hypothetical protein
MAIAASLSASEALSARTRAARACSNALRTRLSVSLASAVSINGRAATSRVLKTEAAASSRLAGSGDMMVSVPMAASMARRMRLFTRGALKPCASATGWPVRASANLPSGF